ncbi:type II toxin-antitoxin system PemK/MazF family toxin [Paenibacillus timonensis]|uniref:type II toxin-antitoxin system PemK/MazF family toxin n=1 Tax=Paenibacillus timonensis TaxID=225915 RepID=UPI0022E6A6FC|nr:type II toxin-antitoxin system PemK/MazF family toxin [Paenibacillus timonensis]
MKLLASAEELVKQLNDILEGKDEEKVANFLTWAVKKAGLGFGEDTEKFGFPIFRKGIYWAEYGENIGSEENKHRPVAFLWTSRESPIAIVVPLTTQRLADDYFFHVDLEHFNNTALVEQIRTISLRRITGPLRRKGRVASLSDKDVSKIDEAVKKLLTTRTSVS